MILPGFERLQASQLEGGLHLKQWTCPQQTPTPAQVQTHVVPSLARSSVDSRWVRHSQEQKWDGASILDRRSEGWEPHLSTAI